MTIGVREGCTLLTDLFGLVLDAGMGVALRYEMRGVMLWGRTVNNLKFTDCTDLIALAKEHSCRITDKINWKSRNFGVKVSTERKKTMQSEHKRKKIKVGDTHFSHFFLVLYLGGLVLKNENCEDDTQGSI